MALTSDQQVLINKLKAVLPTATDQDVINGTATIELEKIYYPDLETEEEIQQMTTLLFGELSKRGIPNSRVNDEINKLTDDNAKKNFIQYQRENNKLLAKITQQKNKTINIIIWAIVIIVLAYLTWKFVFKK